MNRLGLLLINKASRVFVFGLVSILIPIYLASLHYSPFFVGLPIAPIVGGNVFSNLLLTLYGDRIGRKRLLLAFSLLMLVSGIILFLSTSLVLILVACFLGNISTTGTEAGPFQSVEAGILPTFVSMANVNKSFGLYNMIGYIASSLGALASSTPSYYENNLLAFHLLFLLYGLVGLVLFVIYQNLGNLERSSQGNPKIGLRSVSEKVKSDVKKLSGLGLLDAFGGGFASQYIFSYWFYFVYGVTLRDLGIIFLLTNVITALSTLGATFIADKLGNLRTMVYTHLISNVFLIAIPFGGSVSASLSFLFLRQGMSQMDVPTRQAFMSELFDKEDRVYSYAVTNIFRSIGSAFGGPISGAMLDLGLVSLPMVSAGVSKIAYDFSTFILYRKRSR
ncbi:MAG: MFS transporter [archaeon]|nr:MFS transporter [archaeon]